MKDKEIEKTIEYARSRIRSFTNEIQSNLNNTNPTDSTYVTTGYLLDELARYDAHIQMMNKYIINGNTKQLLNG